MSKSRIVLIIILFIAAIAAGMGISGYLLNQSDDGREVVQPPRGENGRTPPTTPPPTPPPPGSTPPTTPPPTPPTGGTPPPPSTVDFIYSFEDLKAGNLGGKIIHCSGPLWTLAHHIEYNEEFSATKSYMVRAGINLFDERFTDEKATMSVKNAMDQFPNEIPFLSILYTHQSGGGNNIGIGKGKELLDGEFDNRLALLANIIKGYNKPVFIRIASEFNGTWNGYKKEYFADSFRYIVDFFDARGVANAIYMWNYMPLNQPFPYMDWYPGDDYIDWWSVEFFDNHVTSPAAKAEQKRFLDDAKAHGKPVIIPESGPAKLDINDVSTWDAWFVPYFALINSDTNIKGFCYSNEDMTQTTSDIGWKDIQIQGTPIAPLYQQELLKPQYLHQQ